MLRGGDNEFTAYGPSRSLLKQWRILAKPEVVDSSSSPTAKPTRSVVTIITPPATTIAAPADLTTPSVHPTVEAVVPPEPIYIEAISTQTHTVLHATPHSGSPSPCARTEGHDNPAPHGDGVWYEPQLRDVQQLVVANASPSRALVVVEGNDNEEGELLTEGPPTSQRKTWSVDLPDVIVPLLEVFEVEEDRERRRRHPDAALHDTRARFVRGLGLTEADTVDPITGINILAGDDARRSYYGYPEDAAWITFFANMGRPLEDFRWLKVQVFVDDETAASVPPALVEDSGAAAMAQRSNISRNDELAAALMNKWNTTSPSPLNDDATPVKPTTARATLLSSYRSTHHHHHTSTTRSAGDGDGHNQSVGDVSSYDDHNQSGPILSTTPMIAHRLFASRAGEEGGLSSRLGHHHQFVAQLSPSALSSPYRSLDQPLKSEQQVDPVDTKFIQELQRAAMLSTPQRSHDGLVAPNTDAHTVRLNSTFLSPVGSYDRQKIAELEVTSQLHYGQGELVGGTTDGGDVAAGSTPPPSMVVSMPITNRYRPTSSSPLVASMPPITSGREYRNQMRARFLERKEKGVVPPIPLVPHKPSSVICPAAEAILKSSPRPPGILD